MIHSLIKKLICPYFFDDVFAYRIRNSKAEIIWNKFTAEKDWKEKIEKIGGGPEQHRLISQNLFEVSLIERLSSLYYHN